MENQWDHFQQDLFKKANHRMANLANFYPSLEEKQKFYRALPTGCRMPAFTTPQSTRKKVDKDMLWIHWKSKRRFSWPNNIKFQRGGNNNFLSE